MTDAEVKAWAKNLAADLVDAGEVETTGLNLYAKRHLVDLEPYYSAHVSAMTTEGLHNKADIAAELAWRDKKIERLVVALAELLNKWESIPEPTGWDQSVATYAIRICARELREALKGRDK